MRILYINHYAGSTRHGMEYRTYYLAREWVQSGNAVRILAASHSHVRSTQPAVNDSPITRRTAEWIDGIEYIWYPTPSYAGNGIGRAWNIWAFLRQVWSDAHKMATDFRPDIVIASSTYPMDIWAARRIARSAGARLVYEVHDLWPLTPIELGGMSPRHPFVRLCQAAENAAYRDADIVVSVLPKVSEHMAAHGLELRKLHIVPNGITLDEWQGTPPAVVPGISEYVRLRREEGNVIVGYAGSHGVPNALDSLLDAASRLKSEPFAFVLVGDGTEKAHLERRVGQEGLNNVRLFPPIPKAQVPSFLAQIDIAYVGWRRAQIYRFGIAPNKMMDYMMAGCVVLHSMSAGNDPVAEAGCGLTVPPESPQAIAEGLQRLSRLTTTEREAMGRSGRAYVEAHHLYPVLARKFASIMEGGQ
jgi:glycosyltransferase involved in cell wall biosynthesis